MRLRKILMLTVLSVISFGQMSFADNLDSLDDNYLHISITENKNEKLNMSEGEVSPRIYNIQKTLKYLGYYNKDINGVFNSDTLESLIIFQSKHGLVGNGELNKETTDKISSYNKIVNDLEEEEFNKRILENRKKIEAEQKAKNSAKLIDWFKEGQYMIPRKSTFKVTDVKTGKSFMLYRMGGTNHADCEPLTKTDTAIMKSLYGNWSWDRRAVIVEPSNSTIRIAASMAGMPHGTMHKKDNNFNGHFDLHFYNSKTHGSSIIEPWHQRTLKTAVGK